MEDPLAWQGIATKCLHSLYGGGTCWLLIIRFVSDIVALCLNQNVTHLSSFDTWNLANQGEEAKQAELGPMCLCGAMFFPAGKTWNPLQASPQRNIKEFKGAGILQVLNEILHPLHFFLEHCFFSKKHLPWLGPAVLCCGYFLWLRRSLVICCAGWSGSYLVSGIGQEVRYVSICMLSHMEYAWRWHTGTHLPYIPKAVSR